MAGTSTAICPEVGLRGCACLDGGGFLWEEVLPGLSAFGDLDREASKTLWESPLSAISCPNSRSGMSSSLLLANSALILGPLCLCTGFGVKSGSTLPLGWLHLPATTLVPGRIQLYQFEGPAGAAGASYAHFLGCHNVFRAPTEALASPGSLFPGLPLWSHAWP